MLLHQLHPVDSHATVHRFAHVVHGQQGHLKNQQNQRLTKFKTQLISSFQGVGGTGLGQKMRITVF
jgi:hypothetical protein